MIARTTLGLVGLLLLAPAAHAQQPVWVEDSTSIVWTVEQFHQLIAAGDSVAALALLTDDAVILESGGLETKPEFRSHHLAADINFAKSAKTERRLRSVVQRGDVAWVAATSTTTRTVDGREVGSTGAELMVLSRTPSGWRISAIHWSSRRQRS